MLREVTNDTLSVWTDRLRRPLATVRVAPLYWMCEGVTYLRVAFPLHIARVWEKYVDFERNFLYEPCGTSLSFVGKFGSPYLATAQQMQVQCYPFLPMSAVFPSVQTMLWLPVFRIFNVHTEVSACSCTWGLYRHCKRALEVDWEKNPLPHQGLEPTSVLRLVCQSDAVRTDGLVVSSECRLGKRRWRNTFCL